MPLDSAVPQPSASGARLTGDDLQHAIAWYHALLSIQPTAKIASISVEAANAGNVDDVVIRRTTPPDDYLQIKASVSAKTPASMKWLTSPGARGGPSILKRFHDFYSTATATGSAPTLHLITTRSIDPDDPILTLRDRNERVADALRRASSAKVIEARRAAGEHLGLSEEELFAFLDDVRIRTDASEAQWIERISHLGIALGLDSSELAATLGIAEVREWVKTSRIEKTPADVEAAINRLGLRRGEPWETLVVQALDQEPNVKEAAVALDWVAHFAGDQARTRRGLKDPGGWNTVLRSDLIAAEAALGSKRILVRGYARLPVWFAVGTQLARTRGYHVGTIQSGKLWSSECNAPGSPSLIPTCIHPPQEGEPLALSIAVSADPSAEASTHLQAIGTTMGHLRLAPAEGASSQAIISPEHAWSTALKLRDEVRRIVATLRPPAVHLFLATPGGLALLLGHVWDRMPLTQTYEDLGPNGYQPAFIIPN
jgi:hypothetical protein